MSRGKIGLVFFTAVVLWPLILTAIASRGWLWKPLADPGDAKLFARSIADELRNDQPPNAAFTLIQNGEVAGELFISEGNPVDRHTLFQVMSISKWVSAWVVLSLVEAGDLELDAPITNYLSAWQLPESEYDESGVTVRRLLSHTAGVNNGDFEGFLPDQEMQSLVEFMTHPADGGAHGHLGRQHGP